MWRIRSWHSTYCAMDSSRQSTRRARAFFRSFIYFIVWYLLSRAWLNPAGAALLWVISYTNGNVKFNVRIIMWVNFTINSLVRYWPGTCFDPALLFGCPDISSLIWIKYDYFWNIFYQEMACTKFVYLLHSVLYSNVIFCIFYCKIISFHIINKYIPIIN